MDDSPPLTDSHLRLQSRRGVEIRLFAFPPPRHGGYDSAVSDAKRWLLEHTRSTAAEGRSVMFGTIATCIGMAILLPVLFPHMWDEDRIFFVVWYGLLAVVAMVGVAFGVRNIRSGGTFYCRLSTDRLECHCPVSGCGESFSIIVREISKIEEVTSSGSSSSWYVWDHSGCRYNLTINYGNPAEQFVGLIRELNPAAEEIRS